MADFLSRGVEADADEVDSMGVSTAASGSEALATRPAVLTSRSRRPESTG
jgi:hypothetical protein